MNQLFTSLGRTSAIALTAVLTIVLAGCGPEAPPCNDIASMHTAAEIVTSIHDERLRGYPRMASDMANFSIETPTVASYDDKLKTRTCHAMAVMQLKPAVVKEINQITTGLQNPMVAAMGFISILGIAVPDPLAQLKTDAAILKLVNPGAVTDAPVRVPVTYRIQKEEGSDRFVTSASMDVSGTLPYLKVAALAHSLTEQVRVDDEKRAKDEQQRQLEAQQKQAEAERIASSAQAVATPESVAPASAPANSPAPVVGAAPKNLTAVITRFEICGPEAICLFTAKGNTVWMNSETLGNAAYAVMQRSIKSHQPLCLKDLVRNSDKEFTAEALAEHC